MSAKQPSLPSSSSSSIDLGTLPLMPDRATCVIAFPADAPCDAVRKTQDGLPTETRTGANSEFAEARNQTIRPFTDLAMANSAASVTCVPAITDRIVLDGEPDDGGVSASSCNYSRMKERALKSTNFEQRGKANGTGEGAGMSERFGALIEAASR